MISIQSAPDSKDVVIKATIRELMNDGSKTVTVRAIKRGTDRRGLGITSQGIFQYLRRHPGLAQYGNIPKYWVLEGEL